MTCRICHEPSSKSLCERCGNIGVPRSNVVAAKPEKLGQCVSCKAPINPDFERCRTCDKLRFIKEL